jgi:hypothetical protein
MKCAVYEQSVGGKLGNHQRTVTIAANIADLSHVVRNLLKNNEIQITLRLSESRLPVPAPHNTPHPEPTGLARSFHSLGQTASHAMGK